MTQAKGHISPDSVTTSLTRRAALIGLAAVATPATAGAVCVAPVPDAALVEAGREFDRTVALFADAQNRSRPYWKAWEEALAKIPRNESRPDSFYVALGEDCDRQYPIAFPTCDDVANMMDAPMQTILALPARTIEGVAVKARIVRWHYSKIWNQPAEDNDLDDRGIRSLIEAVEALAVRS